MYVVAIIIAFIQHSLSRMKSTKDSFHFIHRKMWFALIRSADCECVTWISLGNECQKNPIPTMGLWNIVNILNCSHSTPTFSASFAAHGSDRNLCVNILDCMRCGIYPLELNWRRCKRCNHKMLSIKQYTNTYTYTHYVRCTFTRI